MINIDEIKIALIKTQLQTGNKVKVKANGTSMKPSIKNGDLLILKKSKNDQYREGEIIVFTKEKLLFIHRLISIDNENGLILTKGDNLEVSDTRILKEECLAKVIRVNNKVIKNSIFKNFSFRFYCFIMLFNNNRIVYKNKQIIKVYLSSFRFSISKKALKVLRL